MIILIPIILIPVIIIVSPGGSISPGGSRCQTYEGGFGAYPGCEAHGGYTFCAFAALCILKRYDVFHGPRLLVKHNKEPSCIGREVGYGRRLTLLDLGHVQTNVHGGRLPGENQQARGRLLLVLARCAVSALSNPTPGASGQLHHGRRRQ